MDTASSPRRISREAIIPLAEYGKVRDQRRREMAAFKRDRRVHVGPDVTFYFENYTTMLHQVHEMLFIEKGGEAQVEDELRAYNPLIPQGRELVATMMIEVEDAVRRARVLRQLGNIEATVALEVGDLRIPAVAESDIERTTADGKTSSVHFLKFPFSQPAVDAFKNPATRVLLAIEHTGYQHIAVLPDTVRKALAADLG